MLLGKLATPATKVYQSGAFNTTTATAEYMVVSTQRFVIGEDKTYNNNKGIKDAEADIKNKKIIIYIPEREDFIIDDEMLNNLFQ